MGHHGNLSLQVHYYHQTTALTPRKAIWGLLDVETLLSLGFQPFLLCKLFAHDKAISGKFVRCVVRLGSAIVSTISILQYLEVEDLIAI